MAVCGDGEAEDERVTKVILLGAPGSGKGTQAELIQQKLNIPHISTGDMLRHAVRTGTDLGRKAEPIMKRGDLISDDLMNGIVEERLAQGDVSEGFVLDGYPRTLNQAEAFDRFLEGNGNGGLHVFHLSVPDDVIVGRVTDRVTCPSCGAIYHRKTTPPKEEGVCDRCGSTLVARADDQEAESVRTRLREYHRETEPLVDYYRNKKVLHEIDGLGDIDSIFEQISGVLS